MFSKFLLVFSFILLAMVSLGCGPILASKPTPTPVLPTATMMPTETVTPTATATTTPFSTPTPSPTATPQLGALLYSNKFDNSNDRDFPSDSINEALLLSKSHSTWRLSDGVYLGEFTGAGHVARSVRMGELPGDVDITLDIIVKKYGGDHVLNGVYCRDDVNFQNQHSHYGFYIYTATSLGTGFVVEKLVNGKITFLAGPTQSTTVLTGEATNTMRVICSGRSLQLFVNGKLLASLTDDALKDGVVYLHAEAGAPGTTIGFSNLIIRAPLPVSP